MVERVWATVVEKGEGEGRGGGGAGCEEWTTVVAIL